MAWHLPATHRHVQGPGRQLGRPALLASPGPRPQPGWNDVGHEAHEIERHRYEMPQLNQLKHCFGCCLGCLLTGTHKVGLILDQTDRVASEIKSTRFVDHRIR